MSGAKKYIEVTQLVETNISIDDWIRAYIDWVESRDEMSMGSFQYVDEEGIPIPEQAGEK